MRHLTAIPVLILLAAIIVGTAHPAATPARSAEPVGNDVHTALIPVPLKDAPKPTIAPGVSSGISGETISVSGQGATDYPGVRVAWLVDGATHTASVVALSASGTYEADIAVPDDTRPGEVQICAAFTGTELAAFTCAPFTIEAPPPGTVEIALPPALAAAQTQALDAEVNLYDRTGAAVASAPLQSGSTSLTISNVPPGSYTVAVKGHVPVLFEPASITIFSNQQAHVELAPVSESCLAAMVVAVRATPSGTPTDDYDFGTYISFWPLTPAPDVTVEADIQMIDEADLGLLVVDIAYPDRDEARFAVIDPPQQGTTYSGTTRPSDEYPGLSTLTFEPQANYVQPDGTYCDATRTAARTINIIDNPIAGNPLQPDPFPLNIFWENGSYKFTIWFPDRVDYEAYDYTYPSHYVEGSRVLPLEFPQDPPDVPFLPTPENVLGMGVRTEGTIDLDGNIRIQRIESRVKATIFGVGLVDEINQYIPPAGAPALNPGDLRNVKVAIPRKEIFSFDKSLPVYGGYLGNWSLDDTSPIVSFSVNASVGARGSAHLGASVYPLAPALEADLLMVAAPNVAIDVEASAFYGFVKIITTFSGEGAAAMPLYFSSFDSRGAWPGEVCMRYRVDLTVRLLLICLFETTLFDETLVDVLTPDGCTADGVPLLAQTEPVSEPLRVLASPTVASSPDGQIVAAYIEDTTPNADIPSSRVLARFWDSSAQTWGAPAALTDGSHFVDSPVAAFVGPDGQAMVAWGEKVMTRAEAEAAGADIAAHSQRLEIFYAVWDGSSAWGAPQQLTDNNLPDGRAAIAGDESGATVAWVRDTDGNAGTRTDQAIAVALWDSATGTWGDTEILDQPPAQGTMNYDVSAARSGGTSLLAWSSDGDGNPSSTDDLHIIAADRDGSAWNLSRPAELPYGSEIPSVAIGSGGTPVYLGFLVRSDDGGFGTQREVWSALRAGGEWTTAQVQDEQGQPVYGERPRMSVSASGEPLLLFRRFGAANTNAGLGQLALAQLGSDGTPAVPLDLTDEPRQNWQPALAINQQTGEAVMLGVEREIRPTDATSATSKLAHTSETTTRLPLQSVTLSTNGDPVETLIYGDEADPALDPQASLSALHATPGSTVQISVTVRNLGRAPASDLSITFYEGTPEEGSVLDSVALDAPLNFNEAQVVTFDTAATSGNQPITAVVSGNGGNASTSNDRASAIPGALPQPTLLVAAPDPRLSDMLDLAWQPPDVAGIEGYRVLRATTAGGPYELVGETTSPTFADTWLENGQTYHYVVQAYDASGVLSPFSEETAILFEGSPGDSDPTDHTLYIPLVSRGGGPA